MLLAGIIFQNIVAIGLIAALFLSPGSRGMARLVFPLGAGILLSGVLLAGVWIYPPLWGAAIYAGLFALACLRWFRRSPSTRRSASIVQLAIGAMFSAAGSFLLWQGLAGRIAPDGEFIDLAPPLAAGVGHCVLSGGTSQVLNLHYIEGEKTAASFEKHSVDFVRQSGWGFRTVAKKSHAPKPRQLSDYAVYGSEVSAPCSGTVIGVENDRPDVMPGHANRSLDGSNHVLLRCEKADVLLAHLQRGTVAVTPGETVAQNAPLGLVGNSGNTEEPHLHINAQKTLGDGTTIAVPMRFSGRFLARGDCL